MSRSRPTPPAKALLIHADPRARPMGESAHVLDGHGTRAGGAEPALPASTEPAAEQLPGRDGQPDDAAGIVRGG